MLYTRIICYINLYSSDENVCPMCLSCPLCLSYPLCLFYPLCLSCPRCLSCPLFRVVPPTALPAARGNYDRITKRPVICSTSTSFVICFRYAIIVPTNSCKILGEPRIREFIEQFLLQMHSFHFTLLRYLLPTIPHESASYPFRE